ncbi:hypothetical protein R6Q57_000942 [Mikania cordata]
MAFVSDFNCPTTTIEGRLSNFSECSSSLSFVSEDTEFTQTNILTRSQKWKKLMKRLVKGNKKSFFRSSKPSVYSYDAVSYSLNFDDGNHDINEYYLH